MSLLFDEVLAHIQRAGDQNDEALDDVLQAGIDGKEGQRSEDDTQDENAEHDAADLAGAADERNAADDAGRNGITLIVQAGGLRDGADAYITPANVWTRTVVRKTFTPETLAASAFEPTANMFLPNVVLFHRNQVMTSRMMA